MPEDQDDVILIGGGPGGASLAYRQASTGKRILMLERVGYLPRSHTNWDVNGAPLFVDGEMTLYPGFVTGG